MVNFEEKFRASQGRQSATSVNFNENGQNYGYFIKFLRKNDQFHTDLVKISLINDAEYKVVRYDAEVSVMITGS